MKTVDLHGHRMDEAISLFTSTLNHVRMMGVSTQVCFITGNGEIRQKYVELAREYELDYFDYDLGRLWITFE